ncbi:MAG TPA: hypothetical protein VHN14_29940 [Kofleriaceae bacterium]|jgi:hypothetical protein|nr:hypothetical protein [Kofleriaceae bacterium]
MSNETAKSSVPLIPALTSQSGHYAHTTEDGGQWEYAYDLQAAGTKSERRIGQLHADGLQRVLAAAKPGDRIDTPWGVMAKMLDSPYERGFLLEHTYGKPLDPSTGHALPVPEPMLARGGRWRARIAPWTYVVTGMAMTMRSERRVGTLRFGAADVIGDKKGDYVDTPWGRLHWMGPVDLAATTAYEQGMLLRGTYDAPLDDLVGEAIFPSAMGRTVHLGSCYLDTGFRLAADGPGGHTVQLLVSGRLGSDTEMSADLILDPNRCSLDAFGDREGCTRMAVRRVEVTLVRQRLADPRQLGRRYFAVTGPELPAPLALIVDPNLEHCCLKLDHQLVPLYVGYHA